MMLRLPLSLASLVLSSLLPSATTARLNWTSTRDRPAFSDPQGEKIRGVNLGGWFVLENWMQSTMFAVPPLDGQEIADEWSYCAALGKTECASRLESHFGSYIVEADFREIAQRGLNTVRIPFPYWALVPLEDWEPYVNATQLDHLQQGLLWAKTYDLDVIVDLHSVPGSQNGFDNSGRKGVVEFCSNTTNVDRAIDAVAKMTAAITKEEFGGVVKAVQVINEPILGDGICEFDTLADFYKRSYDAVRAAEYTLEGALPVMVVIHDAFQQISNWDYFFTDDEWGASWDNFGLDTHIYQAFANFPSFSWEQHLNQPCTRTAELEESNSKWTTFVGEMSLGTQTYCVQYQECIDQPMSANVDLSPDTSIFVNHFWEAQRAVYERSAGWIFWSWKTDAAPTWSFQTSTRQGWVPEGLTNNLYTFNASSTEYCSLLKDSSEAPTFATDFVENSYGLRNESIRTDTSTPTTNSTTPPTTSINGTRGGNLPLQGIGESSESDASLALGLPVGLLLAAALLHLS